jgi:hypothetical protein
MKASGWYVTLTVSWAPALSTSEDFLKLSDPLLYVQQ